MYVVHFMAEIPLSSQSLAITQGPIIVKSSYNTNRNRFQYSVRAMNCLPSWRSGVHSCLVRLTWAHTKPGLQGMLALSRRARELLATASKLVPVRALSSPSALIEAPHSSPSSRTVDT